MKALLGLLLFTAAIVMGLRYLRRREILAFRDADIHDFRQFKQQLEKRTEDPVISIMLSKAGVLAQADQSTALSPEDMLAPEARLYSLKSQPFDDVTRNMISVLHEILPDDVAVLRNVPLAEFIRTESPDFRLQNTLVPFVICRLPALSVICGCRLRDVQGHGHDLVKSVFSDIGMPLLNFPLSNDISTNEVREQLDPVLAAQTETVKTCSKCGDQMMMRKSVNGRNMGKLFWVCRQFPRCRGIVQI